MPVTQVEEARLRLAHSFMPQLGALLAHARDIVDAARFRRDELQLQVYPPYLYQHVYIYMYE